MPILRRIAMWVMNRVEDRASVVTRPWILAMRAEMELAPSDWQALGWALGSLRVLLTQRRGGKLPAVGEMERETNKLMGQMGRYQKVMVGFMGATTGQVILQKYHPSLGWALLGVLMFSYWLQISRMNLKDVPVVIDPESERRQYRVVLGYWYQIWSGPWFWTRIALVFGALAFETEYDKFAGKVLPLSMGFVFAVGFAVALRRRWKTRDFLRRLDALEQDERM